MYQEKVIEADDIADVLLIGEQIAKDWLCPMGFSLRRGYPVLKEKISNPAQAHAGEGKASTLLFAGIGFYQSFMDLFCVPD
nr:hypothetical protein [Dubosiella newyorkensis]